MKKSISFLLAVILVLTFVTSCGKSSANVLKNAFSETLINLPEQFNGFDNVSVSNLFADGDTVCMTASVDIGNEKKFYFLRTDKDGNFNTPVELNIEIPVGGYASISNICVTGDGSIWFSVYGYYFDKSGNYYDIRSLNRNFNGKTEIISEDKSVYSMVTADNYVVVLCSSNNLVCITPDGVINEISVDLKDIYIDKVLNISGKFYVLTNNNAEISESALYEIDIKNDKLGNEFKVTEPSDFYASFNGSEYGFYCRDDYYVYGCTFSENGELVKTKLLDFIDSNIYAGNVYNIAPFSPDEFLITGYDDGDYCAIFKRIPDNEASKKQVITLGTLDLTSGLQQKIINFNKSNSQYHISAIDYSNEYKDIETALLRLSTDLTSNKGPDILQIDSNIPYGNYVAKNLFADLYKLMDADKSFNRGDYLENVFGACETGGKLYSLITGFSIETYAAKASNLGGLTEWDFKTFVDFANKNPDMDMFSQTVNRNKFLQTYISYAYNSLVDKTKGTSNFDTDEFRAVLEFAKQLGTEEIESYYRDDTPYRENKVLLSDETLWNFDSFKTTLLYTFNGEPEFIGFPCNNGNGAVISTEYVGFEFAVLNGSKAKNGAWEFLKSFISEETQMPKLDSWGNWTYENYIPVLKKAVEKMYEISTEGEGGNEWDAPLKREQADKMMSVITGTKQVLRTDTALAEIVIDAAGAYFAGQKPLDDVIGEIQNRVNILVNE